MLECVGNHVQRATAGHQVVDRARELQNYDARLAGLQLFAQVLDAFQRHLAVFVHLELLRLD